MKPCSVCGGTTFVRSEVLWPGLVDAWQLSAHEREYIDRQQGERCTACGSNLRSIALADAIRAHCDTALPLSAFVRLADAKAYRVLEINEAGALTPCLKQFPNYRFGAYPEIDMHRLPFEAGSFDLVIHSDTLEHVENPIHALAECRRVLRPEGAVVFTVPVVVGRLSRSREGLPKSYHGASDTGSDDFLVRSEFGADVWTYIMQAGFQSVTLHAVEFPCALALRAMN